MDIIDIQANGPNLFVIGGGNGSAPSIIKVMEARTQEQAPFVVNAGANVHIDGLQVEAQGGGDSLTVNGGTVTFSGHAFNTITAGTNHLKLLNAVVDGAVSGTVLAYNNVTIQGVFHPNVYPLSSLPSVQSSGLIIVSGATGGQVLCYSNGTNWISVKTGIPVN